MQDYYTAFDAQMSEAYLVEHGEAPIYRYLVHPIIEWPQGNQCADRCLYGCT